MTEDLQKARDESRRLSVWGGAVLLMLALGMVLVLAGAFSDVEVLAAAGGMVVGLAAVVALIGVAVILIGAAKR